MKLLLGQLFEFLFVFYPDVKVSNGEMTASLTNGAGPSGIMSPCRGTQLGHHLSLCLKLNSKCITDVSRRPDTLNQLEKETDVSRRPDSLNQLEKEVGPIMTL